MQIINKIMARGRHSFVLEVEMGHFRYCTDNFLGAESEAPSATPKPVSSVECSARDQRNFRSV